MKKTKLEKGITLIALIITIVVLLILAVVTIGAIQESKIIAHAKNASSGYNDEKSKEESAIAGYESLIDSKLPGGNGGSKVTYKDGVPVPSGFYYVTGTKDTGLVIENETEGSQFVWVPVKEDIDQNGYGLNTDGYREPDVVTQIQNGMQMLEGADKDSINLERAECEDTDKNGTLETNDFKIQLTNEYKAMVESVNKYDGFYVGRYETSINGTNPQSKASTAENIIESATAAADSANTWYGLYALNKKYNTSSVQSSMMWGSQYNAMMDWMGEVAKTKIGDNRNMNRTCGTAQADAIKNVYDLYGNCFEWTLEACSVFYRVCRGGNANYSYSPSDSITLNPTKTSYVAMLPTYTVSNLGSRLALYIV